LRESYREAGKVKKRTLLNLSDWPHERIAGFKALARSTFDLFGIVKRIVDAKAQFRSLAEPWADTGTSTGRLMIAVLGGLAAVAARPLTAPAPSNRFQHCPRTALP
jgi:hypothetical protein